MACKSLTIFVFDPKLFKFTKQEIGKFIKIIIDSKWVDCLSEQDSDVCDPCFEKISEASNIIKTDKQFLIPLYYKNKDVMGCMQLEFKAKRGYTEKDNRNYNIDFLIFKIFSSFLQMKCDSLFSEMDSKFKEKHLFDTLNLVSKITTQRSYKALIKEISDLLPVYFGFESVGVLLSDTKTKDLFTITDFQKDKKDIKEGDEYAEWSDTILIPSNLGLTGQVYKTGEIFICNQAATERRFVADVDNLSSVMEVDNFMIGPIYNDPTARPIGIVQLINK